MNYNVIKTNNTVIEWFCLIALSFSAFVSVASDSLNAVALYVLIPFVFIYCFIREKKLFSNRYEKLLILLYIWVSASSLWASNVGMASNELRAVLGAFLLTFIISVLAKKQSLIPWLYILFIFLYLGAWYYASQNMLIVMDFAAEERVNDAKLNANTLAYYTFFVTFVLFILAELYKTGLWNLVFKIAFFIMIPFSFFVALTTASRQVLLIQIPLFIFLLWFRYMKKSKIGGKIFILLIAVFAVAIFLPQVEGYLRGSYLLERSQGAVQDDSRMLLMKDAINVGIEHFPFGVGAGNYRLYSPRGYFSHNTFTELFANTGIIGLLIYIGLVFSFLKKQWARYRATRDLMYGYFFVFGVFYIVDQFFFVFYTHLWLMSFFMLVASHSETYYKSSKTI